MEKESLKRSVDALPDSGLFGDRFEPESVLGSGGSSVVYKAYDRVLDRTVALKLLSADYGADSLQKFRNEAKTSRFLEHPNIVRTLAEGIASNGQPYLVMEILTGKPLNVLLAEGQLDRYRFEQIFFPIIDALSFAHSRSVIHSDIKPSNIFIATQEDGWECPKLLDFGIARLLAGETHNDKEATITPVGTPLYMSPEQCTGSHIDERSDIYSLACVMYEALTGKPPFAGETSFETMWEHLSKSVPDFDEMSGPIKIPRAVSLAILKALKKKPSERQISMEQFRQELHEAFSLSSGRTVLGMRRVSRPKLVLPMVTVTLFGVCTLMAAGILHSRSTMNGGFEVGNAIPASVSQSIGPYPLLNAAHTLTIETHRNHEKLGEAEFISRMQAAASQVRQAIRLGESADFAKDKDLQFSLHAKLGDILSHIDPTEAMKEYSICKAMYAPSDSEGRLKRLHTSRAIANLHNQVRDYRAAVKELKTSIEEFKRSGSEKEISLAGQYSALASYMEVAGDPEEQVLKVRKECLRIAQSSAVKFQDKEVIREVLNLSAHYRRKKDLASARRIIKEAEENLASNHDYFGGQLEHGVCLQMLANGYRANGEPVEALRVINLAISESEDKTRRGWDELRKELQVTKGTLEQQLAEQHATKLICN